MDDSRTLSFYRPSSLFTSGAGRGRSGRVRRGLGRALQAHGQARRAADGLHPRAILLHLALLAEPRQDLREDARGVRLGRLSDAVVHPLAVAPRRDDARAAQVREVARNLRLALAEHLDEEADADLARRQQVQEPQPRAVGQSPEEQLHLRFPRILFRHPQSTPTTLLRRSNRTVSRQRPRRRPTRSRRPTSRKPQRLCSVTLAAFSGKTLACKVQKPPAPAPRTSVSRSARPPPRPLASPPT